MTFDNFECTGNTGCSYKISNLFALLVKPSYNSRIDLKPSDLPDETECRLGRWYYEGEGQTEFSRLPGYREMEAPHKAVHDLARQAVERYRNGDFAGALSALTRMEEANLTVMAGMERILAQGPRRIVAP